MTYPTVMVTGHRPQHMSEAQRLFARAELDRLAQKLVDERGMRVGISGMAIGADTDWCFAVLAAGAALWSYVPFEQQADKWSIAQRDEWYYLRRRAARELVLDDHYSVAGLHARNDRMLADSDLVVACWDPTKSGGTASCVQKARRLGRPIIHVNLAAFATTATGLQ